MARSRLDHGQRPERRLCSAIIVIVAKNGILMLDFVKEPGPRPDPLALVRSGRRRPGLF
jgi:hypothetical protein